MKKIFQLFAVMAISMMVACGSGAPASTESTETKSDSVACAQQCDGNHSHACADSVKCGDVACAEAKCADCKCEGGKCANQCADKAACCKEGKCADGKKCADCKCEEGKCAEGKCAGDKKCDNHGKDCCKKS